MHNNIIIIILSSFHRRRDGYGTDVIVCLVRGSPNLLGHRFSDDIDDGKSNNQMCNNITHAYHYIIIVSIGIDEVTLNAVSPRRVADPLLLGVYDLIDLLLYIYDIIMCMGIHNNNNNNIFVHIIICYMCVCVYCVLLYTTDVVFL